jgi:hypothetical protein
VTCDESGEDVSIESMLTGFPRPKSEMGLRALLAEMRRQHTEQMRAWRERDEKTCPSVFTLLPAKAFKQLETMFESFTKEDELELTLYCEHDSGWHTTAHGVYRFRPDQQWIDSLKKYWNRFVGVTKLVTSMSEARIEDVEIAAWELTRDLTAPLARGLGEREEPQFVEIETRHILQRLIEHLDTTQRGPTEPHNGGLHPHIVDDGRRLWLCPEHIRSYRTR